MVTVRPDAAEFQRLARENTVVPVWCELVGDVETPVSAYHKLAPEAPCFLLESAEQNDQVGRFSFLGIGARLVVSGSGNMVRLVQNGTVREYQARQDPFKELEELMAKYRCAQLPELPHFWGGAVGFLTFDAVRWFEPVVPASPNDDLGVPDMRFAVTETVIVFDHRKRRIRIVASAFTGEEGVEPAYQAAIERIQKVVEKLSCPLHLPPVPVEVAAEKQEARSNTTRGQYFQMVKTAQEYIRAGDIFQIVPSQRFETDFTGRPMDLYRSLRFINPSPYMFFLDSGDDVTLVGSSPEVHVRLTEDLVEIRPIAGTRRRGETPEQDAELAEDLLGDPKERAEHLMLVDLARNDVGRIAKFGSVKVSDFMTIERYSHVMHIVSHVSGKLEGGRNAYDVMRATFPAGTVSGAPKVRAMQIINQIEQNKRGTYAGAVGYFGFDGNLDSCIALRTILLRQGKAYVQAGGGVVADSTPEGEYQETVNKSMGALRAVERAKALAKL